MEERELDLQQEVEIGYKAKTLLEELEPYFSTMEAQLVLGIYDCSVSDVDTLHGIKLQLHALSKLKLNIQSVIDTGLIASVELTGDLK